MSGNIELVRISTGKSNILFNECWFKVDKSIYNHLLMIYTKSTIYLHDTYHKELFSFLVSINVLKENAISHNSKKYGFSIKYNLNKKAYNKLIFYFKTLGLL